MRHHTSTQKQHGAVLIVSLLFLVILTMLGITAMTGTTFEERMAGNARDAAIAQNAAEAALREARNEILPTVAKPSPRDVAPAAFGDPTDANGSCTTGLCRSRPYLSDVGSVLPDIPTNVDWNQGASTATYGLTTGAKALAVSQPPRYIMELFCIYLAGGEFATRADACRVYRFTAVGWGRNPNTQVTVQETYIAEKAK